MKNIFLADDDADDCLFFKEALDELSVEAQLTIMNNGVELMTTLDETVTEPPPPHVIFLDLNMPRKNGFECLDEIRHNPRFKAIPIVIFSTSENIETVDKTYNQGANHYICKPSSHKALKKVIETVLKLDLWKQTTKTSRSKFLLMM